MLYISYDGMLEPLGESQVVSYVERLSLQQRMTLLSFEKGHDLADLDRRDAMMTRLARAGVTWVHRRYHQRPYLTAKMRDVAVAFWVALRWALGRGRGRIIHARGYIPSLIAIAVKRVVAAKFVFDMRGFWPDERADAGMWRRDGLTYRIVKRLERRLFERADAIVSLTHDGVRAFGTLGYRIAPTTPIAVIPTCVDLERFRPRPKDAALLRELGLEGRTVVGCVGTMSGWYMRREMLEYLALAVRRTPDATALIVTREDHERLRADAEAAGLDRAALVVTRAHFVDMPRYIGLLDAGVMFLRDMFAKRASAATTLAEMLASGVPVVMRRGGGDASGIVEQARAGLVLPDTATASFEQSMPPLHALLADCDAARRCRAAAERHFDLQAGVAGYARLYERLDEGRLQRGGERSWSSIR